MTEWPYQQGWFEQLLRSWKKHSCIKVPEMSKIFIKQGTSLVCLIW